MADPHPQQRNMGGLSPAADLAPGKVWYEKVLPTRYRKLDRPGVYQIEVFHDLGWGERRQDDPRVQTYELTLKEPDAATAKVVIEKMRKLLQHGGDTWGKKGKGSADPTLLTHPVYLPFLVEAGDIQAVKGISRMDAPAATEALLSLMKSENDFVVAWAGFGVAHRIPPAYGSAGVGSSFWPHGRPPALTNTWEVAFSATAREQALQLLTRNSLRSIVSASGILMQLGGQADLPVLIRELDDVFDLIGQPVAKADRYHHPRWALHEGQKALEHLATRGNALAAAPESPAEFMAAIARAMTHTNAAEADLVPLFQAALKHEQAVVREIAVRRVPPQILPSVGPHMIALMPDRDSEVRKAACEVVNNAKLSGLRSEALRAIAMSDDHWTMWMAMEAAVRDGARVECANLLANRFAQLWNHPQYQSMHVMSLLSRITVGGHLSGSWHFLKKPGGRKKADEIRRAWRKLIREHETELGNNGVLELGRKPLRPELVPPGVRYSPAR